MNHSEHLHEVQRSGKQSSELVNSVKSSWDFPTLLSSSIQMLFFKATYVNVLILLPPVSKQDLTCVFDI